MGTVLMTKGAAVSERNDHPDSPKARPVHTTSLKLVSCVRCCDVYGYATNASIEAHAADASSNVNGPER